MRAKYAAEIRLGIQIANEIIKGNRVQHLINKATRLYGGALSGDPLWKRAYGRTLTRAVRRGILRPPRGPAGA